VQHIVGARNEQWSALNMLDTGVCHGMTVHDIKNLVPEQFEAWQRDPFNHRIPGGESYRDLVQRLDPFITELERTNTGVLVVSHLSTLQVLYGYFLGCPAEKCPTLDIPQHTVIELVPNQYGWKEQRFEIDLSKFMEKPRNFLADQLRTLSICAPAGSTWFEALQGAERAQKRFTQE